MTKTERTVPLRLVLRWLTPAARKALGAIEKLWRVQLCGDLATQLFTEARSAANDLLTRCEDLQRYSEAPNAHATTREIGLTAKALKSQKTTATIKQYPKKFRKSRI